MSSKRRSDENRNPRLVLETVSSEIKLGDIKTEPDPSSDKALASSNRKNRLSSFDKKHKRMFENSGMKQGSLLKYVIKADDDTGAITQAVNKSSTSNNNVVNHNGRTAANHTATTSSNDNEEEDDDDELVQNSSQDSDVIFIGENPRNMCSANVEEIVLSPTPSVSDQDNQEDDEESVHDLDLEQQLQQDDPKSNQMNISDSSNDEEYLNVDDKVGKWLCRSKRSLSGEGNATASDPVSYEASPPKSARLDSSSRSTEDNNGGVLASTETSSSRASSPFDSTPPLRILNVYTLNNNPGTSSAATVKCSTSVSSSSSSERVKKKVNSYREADNPVVSQKVGKNNWKAALDAMKKDLDECVLPKKIYVSQLISTAILCDGPRVSKVVQQDGIEFLERLFKEYPALSGAGTDLSVNYYKEIFQKVIGNEDDSEASLFNFLIRVKENAETAAVSKVETKALRLLVLLTQLVIQQYTEYAKESLKVRPPLLQHFLEHNHKFSYNEYSQRIINELFKAYEFEEMFCIIVKWTELIAKQFGEFSSNHKEYRKMVLDMSKRCLDRGDLGLRIFMNLDYKKLAVEVCEEIFKRKLDFVHDKTGKTATKTEALDYLQELARTLIIKPAKNVILDSQVKYIEEISMSFVRTLAEYHTENLKSDQCKRQNVKGETRFHIVCSKNNTLDDPVGDLRKLLATKPEDVNIPDNFGNTPLHDCARYNHPTPVLIFREFYGNDQRCEMLNVLAQNSSLETPLHLAATYCTLENVKIFKHLALSCGVLQDALLIPNEDGKLPFELTSTPEIRNVLTPPKYREEDMLKHNGITLQQKSVVDLKNSFALRKVIAWWHENREH
ncbi:Ankyrin repeat domain-containing protein 32 [Orchesella cincta]|uniref:Ankyrin repeat domain-containing protein 32 n=1 Tax=Orchesella cincta TaxID=48709 RepID=A0A1D2N795_ORCCI|nr:Ankyrin repeat domain-containing protein 32 [Orchesella cincta]